jgi:cell division septation protein DedD
MSQLQHSILYKLIPQDTTLPTIATPVDTETVAQPAIDKESDVQRTADKAVEKPKAAITYCIIVASQVKQSNAEQYVEKLKKQGYPNAYVYINNKVVRVVSDEFSSEAEAYRVVNKMNREEEFWEAWVYKKVEN